MNYLPIMSLKRHQTFLITFRKLSI